MRIAIAHEWLVTSAGAERVLEQLVAEFPQAELLTTVIRPERLPEPLRRGKPSFLQHVPGARTHHGWFLPLMPLAWRLRAPVTDVDAVVSSSYACAKAVRHEASIPHLCYCHTPMRYAWDFGSERARFPAPLRLPVRAAMASFRRWDRRTAERVTAFVANSSAVADRIARFYGRTARVIHPPVRTEFFTPGGERGEDFLFVGRLVSYKRPDLVVDAFADLPFRLLVVGSGHLESRLRARATSNVRFLGEVGDEELRDLYRSARAFVFPGEEDFGIVMAEAHACGTPVVALGTGGATDLVEPGVNGWLIERQSAEDLRAAVRRAAAEELDPALVRLSAERFSEERFRREMRDAVEAMVDYARSTGASRQ